MRSASSTSATTRSTTSTGPAGCRRCSSSAAPSTGRSTSTRCVAGGVGVVGRLMRVDGRPGAVLRRAAHLVADADLKQARLLDRLDEFAVEHAARRGRSGVRRDRRRPSLGACRPSSISAASRRSCGRRATGRRIPWLDPAGVRPARPGASHDGGVGALPGLYFLGLPFMRRRKSSFIDGRRSGRRRAGPAPARPPRPSVTPDRRR